MLDSLCYNPIDSFIPNLPKRGPVSFIRILNAYPQMKRADVNINGHQVFKGIGLRKFTPYIVLPSGQCKINIYPSGKASPLSVGAIIEFQQDIIYTIAICGMENAEILLIVDVRNAATTGSANIRLIQLDPDTPGLSLSEEGSKLFENVSYKHISEYTKLPLGRHMLKGTASGTGKTLFMLRDAHLEQGWNYTIYTLASSGKGNMTPLLLIDGSTYINKKAD